MTWMLGLFAGAIFLLYAVYFLQIVRGRPEEFELDIMKALASWMVSRGSAAKGQMWLMVMLSVLLELVYFVLVFTIIQNNFMVLFTVFCAGYEVIHLVILSIGLSRFFQGQLKLKDIFKWKAERLSAILFFTHSMLVLATLLFFR
ncbi:MAG: hypothetical protein ACM3PE_10610 [Deltaproteobacteria bacterium]